MLKPGPWALVERERHGPNAGMTRHTVDPRDHQLRTAVAAELDWAPEVAADSIGVAVNRGTVILSGERART